MAQETIVLQSTLSDWKTTAQDDINNNFNELYAAVPGGTFTASRAIVSNGSGVLAVSATTATEIGYVSGVTSAIQTQLNGKQPAATGTPDGTKFLRDDNSWQVPPGGSVTDFTDLGDVPASYTGESLKAVRVNAGETGLEFYTPSQPLATADQTLTGNRAINLGIYNLTFDAGANTARLILTATNANHPKIFSFRTGGLQRFAFRVDGAADDFALRRYDNAGAFVAAPIKIDRATGAIQLDELTASRILALDASKNIQALDTATYPSLTELSYVKGLSSDAQTQINSKQATLVSGTNIKTLYGATLLGAGDAGITPKAYGGTGEDNSTGGTANTFWARPNGGTGAAAYRAIVAADIPTLNQNTTGSAATLTTARLINGVSFNGSADIFTFEHGKIMAALGSGTKGYSFGKWVGAGTLALTNQRLLVTSYYATESFTTTGVKWWQVTQGDYTANNYNGVGLFTYSAGTITLVASSTNDGAIWKAATGTLGTKAFSSTYAITGGTTYFIAALWCRSAQVTAPAISPGPITFGASIVLDATNSGKPIAQLNLQTALPASQAMSGMTLSSVPPFLTLY